jgi:hypothetical protein
MSVLLSQKFIKGLEKRGLSISDMENYKYCGGNLNHHLNYWLLVNKKYHLPRPNEENKCICGHDITENCYIINENNNTILILGNCCIEKFIVNKGRRCEDCNNVHHNRKVNRCHDCRKGKCDECNRDCNPKYSLCYRCKNHIIPNNFHTCRKCHRQLNSMQEMCSCENNNNLLNNKCSECKIPIKSEYKKCYLCNSKTFTNKCKICNTSCSSKYETCFKCK